MTEPWIVAPGSRLSPEAFADLEANIFGAASWGRKSVKEGLAASGVTAIIVCDALNDVACGLAMWRNLGADGEILTIGVRPETRRHGAGAALMQSILASAAAEDIKAMFLEVEVENMPARSLYTKYGFARVGERLHYYKNGGDALVMRLVLDA